MNHFKSLGLIVCCLLISPAYSQVVINEVQSSNFNTLTDELGNQDDWIELYNNSAFPIDLSGYQVTDDLQRPDKFVFSSYLLQANDHILVLASGFEKKDVGGHWETAINAGDTWKYRANTSAPPDTNWRNLSFNDNSWSSGGGGIGYGDGDDVTVVPQCISVYMRKLFLVSDTSKISQGSLNIDYDDAFVAYLNGVEIARSNIGTTGARPAWNDPSNGLHEAVMYTGGNPDSFLLDWNRFNGILNNGVNVLAIEVHNAAANNVDLSAIPFLSFKQKDSTSQFGPTPSWFTLGNVKDHFHADFKLNKSGESVYLFNPAAVLVDSIMVPLLELDDAYARTPDGSLQWCFTDSPTPDTTNNVGPCRTGYATVPLFSLQAGFYSGPQWLTLSTSFGGGVIYYTTNGDEPDAASTVYSAPILMTSVKTIRARVIAPTALPSPVVTNTYLINFDCKLPVYVLATDSANLWDFNTGIFVEGPNAQPGNPHWGANYWQGWEKPVSLEYFDRDKNRAFRFNAGLSVTGGWSRADIQKPLEINMGDRYGLNELNYSLLSEKPWVDKLDDFVLHTAGNDRGVAHMRDPLMERLLKTTHVDHITFEPCLLFINGQQWGVYYTRENDDHHFIEQNYGIDKDDIDLLKESYFYPGLEVKKGSDSAFFVMHTYAMNTSPADPGFYDTMNSMMDLENMVDYFAAETFYPNGDWMGGSNNNMKMWRQRSNQGRFRYICYDLDFGYGLADAVTSNVLATAIAASPHNFQSDLFGRLVQNPRFKNYFINRYADLINTIWLPSNVTDLANAFRDSLRYDMHLEYENGWYMGDTNQWKANILDMLDFATQRPAYARDFIESELGMTSQVTLTLQVSPPGAGRIQISTITPTTLPWSGVYFNGNPVTITAIPNPGYTFDHWNSNVVITTSDTNRQTTRNFFSSDQITAYFTGAPAQPQLTISELNYNSDADFDAGDWVELHNLGTFDLDISGWKVKDDQDHHMYVFPAPTIIPANGYLVVAEDLQKFSSQHPAVTNVTGNLGFNFGNGGDKVRLFDYLDTLFLSMIYSDDISWPQGADGGGYTLELLSDTSDLNSGSSWFEGCIGGSPGAPYSGGVALATAAGTTEFCAGGSVTLQANTGGGLTYQWQNGGQLIAGATNSSYDAMQGGLYTVIVSTSSCSAVSDTIVVTVLPGPVDPAVTAVYNCGPASVNLTAVSGDTLSWYDAPNGNLLGSGNTFITPILNVTTVFYVQAVNGCEGNYVPDTVFILSPPADPVALPGSSCGEGAVTLDATATDTLFWYDAIGGALLFTGSPFITPFINSTTIYYVTAGNFCPSNYVAVTATIYPDPVVDLGNDTLATAAVNIDAGGGFSAYLWNTGETTSSINAGVTGIYWVQVTDSNGCTAYDTISVQIFVGLSHPGRGQELFIYPNPAHDELIISLSDPEGYEEMILLDVTGRIVWRAEGLKKGIESLYRIDLSSYARGVYLLKLSGEKVSAVRLLVE